MHALVVSGFWTVDERTVEELQDRIEGIEDRQTSDADTP